MISLNTSETYLFLNMFLYQFFSQNIIFLSFYYRTEKFQKDIQNLTAQLEDLQQKRNKQAEMLETIIRQRDMYRVLLTSQGFSEVCFKKCSQILNYAVLAD